jgi:hypothetical protein
MFVRYVGAEGEKGGKAGNGRRVGCARATHDYGKNVDFIIRPLLANGMGEGGIFVANHVCGVGEVVVRANFFTRIMCALLQKFVVILSQRPPL